MRYHLCVPSKHYHYPESLCSIRTDKPYPHYKSLRIARSVAHRWHFDKKVIIIRKDVPCLNGKTWTYDDCCYQEH
jgi:hypothetical protein